MGLYLFTFVSVFKHCLNPLKPADSEASPWTIVTGLVDQIDFTGKIRPDCDIRMSGETTSFIFFILIIIIIFYFQVM